MRHHNILIINTQPIPTSGVGAASVNRIISYTKGLINNGHSVRVISTGFGSPEWHNYEGIPVSHIGTSKNSSLFSLLKTAFGLLKSVSKIKKDCVLLVTHNFFLTILLGIYCTLSKTKIIIEVNEYPFILMSKNNFKKKLAPLLTNTAYKFIDGIIVISKPLFDFYSSKAKKNCHIIEVPMTVDNRRFEEIDVESRSPYGNYIAYCGNMAGNKDGLMNLLEAFSIVEKKGYPLNLLLIGNATKKEDYVRIQDFNKKLNNKNVIFYGKASRDEIPKLLKGSKILALARPSSLQSTGGFPTKLGEYLATGNPVVITSVGDIPRYLHDKKNAFVVEPDDNNAFADAICYVWDHYDEAKMVGLQGKELTKTIFSGDYQAKQIARFLDECLYSKCTT